MTDERVARLEASMATFEAQYPEVVEALNALGVRVEDYYDGLADATLGPNTWVANQTSSPATTDAQLRRPG